MIKEALDFLSTMFTKASSAKKLDVPGDGRKVFFDQNGTVAAFDVTPGLRKHTVNSVVDLIEAAKRWNDAPVIWLAADKVVLVTDDGDRRDSVTLPLVKSAAFETLLKLADKPVVDQQQLIRILRIDLQGTINRANLLTAIRSIKFKTTDSGHANVQQGNESMGRLIEAEVTGAGDLPETVAVSCAIYSNHGEREKTYTVNCDLEVIASEKKFRFHPLPDEIERVTDAALTNIEAQIAEALKDVPVFMGTP